MSTGDFLGLLLGELEFALEPVLDDLAHDENFRGLVYDLGWPMEGATLRTVSAVRESLGAALQLESTIRLLGSVTSSTTVPDPAVIEQAIEAVRTFTGALTRLGGSGAIRLDAPFDQPGFIAEFGGRLLGRIVVNYLRRRSRLTWASLVFLGIIEDEVRSTRAGGRDFYYNSQSLRLDRFDYLFHLDRVLREVYLWGTSDAPDRFLDRFSLVFVALGFDVIDGRALSEEIRWDGLTIILLDTVVSPEVPLQLAIQVRKRDGGVTLLPVIRGELSALGGVPGLSLRGTAASLPFLEIGRSGSVDVRFNAGGSIDVELGYTFSSSEAGDSGQERVGSGLHFDSVATRLAFRRSEGAVEVVASIRANGELSIGGVDGFLASVLPAGGVHAPFDISVTWSSRTGLQLGGSATLDVQLPVDFSLLGALSVESLWFAIRVGSEGIKLEATAGLSLHLGPIQVSVERVGVWGGLSTQGTELNLGIANLSAGVKFPSGASLTVDAGSVRGGGFIAYDDSLGRYSGALALSISDIALRAIGILDTRAPGVSGYSFLIIISAEFTPIQLGFGFTLNGVGGLCGIQRSVSVAALQEGVRSGSLATLLFARDPVGQATQLITGLQRVFPPTNDRYVFGPMFKLGWGTPTLITADLGILLLLPSPVVIALLGTLSAKLPRPEGAVVEINLDIVGVLDFGEKKLSIDASLRDSRIAAFTLTGDMALRIGWGDDADFALSIGGFNPAFRPPPGFPTLRRLTLALGSGNNPRLSLAGYFALTSNSLQFGARAELYAEAAGFNIVGYLEFHALFIFSPFSFRFDFAAGVSLRRGTSVLMAISVAGRLEGPRPWHVVGSASISILFFEVSVSFDRTFGEPAQPQRLEPVDLWARLQPALQDARNWTAATPEGATRGVLTASGGDGPTQLRVDPMSTLAVRQKVLPLDLRITKLGESPIEGPTRVHVRELRIGCDAAGHGGRSLTVDALPEPFAAAQYLTLTDAERLARPSFERMSAGVQARGPGIATGDAVPFTPHRRSLRVGATPTGAAAVSQRMQAQMAQVDGAALAGLRTTGVERYALAPGVAPMVTLTPPQWSLASTRDLSPAPGVAPGSWSQLEEVRRQRGDASAWQVLPSHEVRR